MIYYLLWGQISQLSTEYLLSVNDRIFLMLQDRLFKFCPNKEYHKVSKFLCNFCPSPRIVAHRKHTVISVFLYSVSRSFYIFLSRPAVQIGQRDTVDSDESCIGTLICFFFFFFYYSITRNVRSSAEETGLRGFNCHSCWTRFTRRAFELDTPETNWRGS